MFGTVLGNICGISYFMIYQILGVCIAALIFKNEKNLTAVFLGSVIGSFCLQWLPALFAFFFDFSVTAHGLALSAMCILTAIAYKKFGKDIPHRLSAISKTNIKTAITANPVLFVLVPLLIFTIVVLLHHTISYTDGAMHSGQSTYGDMNMHLGFITSIAKQQTFPPEYSILPGTKLAYPFLSDTISSSVYIWGSSLRIAYLLPMFFALIQVFFGMFLLARQILETTGRSCRAKVFLAFLLFFFNGGFGFLYFLPDASGNYNFTRIFSGFYETPTNYVPENIQWHNIICDMLIPQRATLFGWAVLFPVLYLIMRGRQGAHYFSYSGILAGGLVLIHTHSFLALGILCAGFLLQDLYKKWQEKKRMADKNIPLPGRVLLTALFLGLMSFIGKKQSGETPFPPETVLLFGLLMIGVFACVLIYLLASCLDRQILSTWGIFLCVVLIFALPQLFGFTFQQAQGEQFVRGSFNWANDRTLGDGYLLFYLKNLGIMFPLTLLSLVFGAKKQRQVMFPAAFLWIICEFILFQPNPYDNNKLLLIAYLFFCIGTADFVLETVPSWFSSAGARRFVFGTAFSLTLIAGTVSAVLTMGREYVSDYEVYSKSYVELAKWVEKHTEPDDIILTATNHNNAVASLTGRNIVCGSSSFLYYHGVDYTQAESDVAQIYQNSSARDSLISEYNISYIVIGPNEQGNYNIPDLQNWINNSQIAYSQDGIVVLAV